MRAAFVQAADAYARSHGIHANQSQIATLSGVNRVDVRRLLVKNSKRRALPQAQQSRLDLVLAAWRSDARFRDDRGRAKPLSYRGKNSDFSVLVRRHGRDVTAKSILQQLLRARAVEVKAERLVISRKGLGTSTEAIAARADLKFLEAQLSGLRLRLGRRAYVSRSVSIQVADQKMARRLQRSMLQKIHLMLSAMDAISYQKELSRGKATHRDAHW